MIQYVLLFRHGSVKRDPFIPDKDQKLASQGIDNGYDVAKIMTETLINQPGKRQIKLGLIWHAPSYHVRQNVGIILRTFEENSLKFSELKIVEKIELSPESSWRQSDSKATTKSFMDSALELQLKENNALLIVGHQPQLGWIANILHGAALPISNSEIVCLAAGSNSAWGKRRWHLLWTIGPSDEKTLLELREKIKSKMDLAKTLGSFIIAVIVITLNLLLDPIRMGKLSNENEGAYPLVAIYLAAASFFLASLLYLATIYAYDRLLMPSRFWGEVQRKKGSTWLVERPPSSAVWILYQNMTRVWNSMFTPATYFVLLGLVAIGYAVFKPKPLLLVMLSIAIITVIGRLYYRHFRPTLGTQD